MRVAEGDTDLGRGQTLPSQLDDLLDDFFRSGLQPRWRSAAVRQSRGRWKEIYESSESAESKCYSQMPFPGACIRPMATDYFFVLRKNSKGCFRMRLALQGGLKGAAAVAEHVARQLYSS